MCDYINQLCLVCFSGGWQHFLWLSPAFCGTKVSVWTAWLCFFLFVWCFAPWPPLGIFNFLYYTYFSRCFGLFHRRPKKKKRWVSILRYSRRAFNFYDFWFIFTALAVPMSRVTPINVASFPSRTFGPLHWIFPRALLMLFYAAPCVFCCVFNECFLLCSFIRSPRLLLIEWRSPLGFVLPAFPAFSDFLAALCCLLLMSYPMLRRVLVWKSRV